MKITVSHDRSKEEAKRAVDRALDELFSSSTGLPIKLAKQQKSWNADTLNFSLVAKMGLMTSPISGTVQVTDHDLMIDVGLGLLERLIPADKAREVLTSRLKGLLK